MSPLKPWSMRKGDRQTGPVIPDIRQHIVEVTTAPQDYEYMSVHVVP